jgi:hypothetical protein
MRLCSKLASIRTQILRNFVAKYTQTFIDFDADSTLLYNPKLMQQSQELSEYHEKKRDAGRAGGEAKRDRASKALAEPYQTSSSASASAFATASESVAAPLCCEIWNLIGVPSGKMPPAFRELCEHLYPTRNGQPLSAFMGTCMDAWAGMGEKDYPPEFAKAKARIKARERKKAPSAQGLSYLDRMPPIPCKS